MEDKKQQAIEKAYGEHFEKCNPTENGWSKIRPQYKKNGSWYDAFDLDVVDRMTHYEYRPKSLSEIGTNNNWISINSNEVVIPNEDVWVCNFNGNKQSFLHHALVPIKKSFTHYQPIQKPNKPIY